jgi:hypothetical protein
MAMIVGIATDPDISMPKMPGLPGLLKEQRLIKSGGGRGKHVCRFNRSSKRAAVKLQPGIQRIGAQSSS